MYAQTHASGRESSGKSLHNVHYFRSVTGAESPGRLAVGPASTERAQRSVRATSTAASLIGEG